ncbi:MAG TPA: hypothetical protein VND93_34395 [Myxococcales bacterium]|nr:hypothetical protein [Myxococcales bacterium]
MSGSRTVASEALAAVIRPLLDLIEPGERKLGGLQNALDLGREAWNLQVEHSGGDLEAALVRSSEKFAGPDVPAAEVRMVLEMLMERKRFFFPTDDRVIVDAVAVQTARGPQMKVTWARFSPRTVH